MKRIRKNVDLGLQLGDALALNAELATQRICDVLELVPGRGVRIADTIVE